MQQTTSQLHLSRGFKLTIMKRIFTSIALSCILLVSCDRMDPDNIYGKNKEMQIIDYSGNAVTKTFTSIVSGGTLTIIGGEGSNHRVIVEDENVLTASYSQKGTICEGSRPVNTFPANVSLTGKKLGRTHVYITDLDTDETVKVEVEVVDEYKALTILESEVEGIDEGMQIAFQLGESNKYQMIIQSGNNYFSHEEGEYDFAEYHKSSVDNHLMLTMKCGEIETVWKITDADNNKDGYEYYSDNIKKGLRLGNSVMTKLTPSWAYPTLFLFTDVSDPTRHFMTGYANNTIKHTF